MRCSNIAMILGSVVIGIHISLTIITIYVIKGFMGMDWVELLLWSIV